MEHKECINQITVTCKQNVLITFMLAQLKQLGCEISIKRKNLICEPCNNKLLGGFDPLRKEVIVCENNVKTSNLLKQVLAHELIHAYDVCRKKYDINNVKQLACSEIRASNLSGECSMWNEFLNLSLGFKAHQQTCVKRKAAESVMLTKNLSKLHAEKVVTEVFQVCFNDTSPHREIPS